jgi:hypothetical protein
MHFILQSQHMEIFIGQTKFPLKHIEHLERYTLQLVVDRVQVLPPLPRAHRRTQIGIAAGQTSKLVRIPDTIAVAP